MTEQSYEHQMDRLLTKKAHAEAHMHHLLDRLERTQNLTILNTVNDAQESVNALDRQIQELSHEWMQDGERWMSAMFF